MSLFVFRHSSAFLVFGNALKLGAGQAWPGLARLGQAWPGQALQGLARPGHVGGLFRRSFVSDALGVRNALGKSNLSTLGGPHPTYIGGPQEL